MKVKLNDILYKYSQYNKIQEEMGKVNSQLKTLKGLQKTLEKELESS